MQIDWLEQGTWLAWLSAMRFEPRAVDTTFGSFFQGDSGQGTPMGVFETYTAEPLTIAIRTPAVARFAPICRRRSRRPHLSRRPSFCRPGISS
jgi:hypothetical protein